MYDAELVVNFCGITDCDPQIAESYLEMAGGDFNTAVSLYFDNDGGTVNRFNDSIPPEVYEDSISDVSDQESGNYNRILESQEIYRPQHVDNQHYSVSVFNNGSSSDSRLGLSRQFDLPEVLKGPFLLEVAREQALYSNPRKWVLLCILDKEDFEGATVNRDLFHDPTVIEIMEYNFIIVQHFADPKSYDQSEGSRLRGSYMVSSLPFFAIINPLTGSLERIINKSEYLNGHKFIECITDFLSVDRLEQLPAITPPSIEMKTSNRVPPITPAIIKPLPKPTTKRDQPSYPVYTSPSKSHANVRDLAVSRPNACRLRLRLPSSISTVCVDKNATVHELVGYVLKNYTDVKDIDILAGNPPVSILNDKHKTLDALKLNGSALIIRSIDG